MLSTFCADCRNPYGHASMTTEKFHTHVFLLRLCVALSGLLLCGAGVVLLVLDLRPETGLVELSMPFISGKVSVTYVGLFVIFLGVMLNMAALFKTQSMQSHIHEERRQYSDRELTAAIKKLLAKELKSKKLVSSAAHPDRRDEFNHADESDAELQSAISKALAKKPTSVFELIRTQQRSDQGLLVAPPRTPRR